MKQLAEVDYFRSCAARNRERREHRRAGRLRRPRESVVARYADTLYGGSVGAGVNFAKTTALEKLYTVAALSLSQAL